MFVRLLRRDDYVGFEFYLSLEPRAASPLQISETLSLQEGI